MQMTALEALPKAEKMDNSWVEVSRFEIEFIMKIM